MFESIEISKLFSVIVIFLKTNNIQTVNIPRTKVDTDKCEFSEVKKITRFAKAYINKRQPNNIYQHDYMVRIYFHVCFLFCYFLNLLCFNIIYFFHFLLPSSQE